MERLPRLSVTPGPVGAITPRPAPASSVAVQVRTQVALLAHSQDVLWDRTDRVAIAEVCNSENNPAPKELGGRVVSFLTPTYQGLWCPQLRDVYRLWLVLAAGPDALATVLGAVLADVGGEREPVRGVEAEIHGHKSQLGGPQE